MPTLDAFLRSRLQAEGISLSDVHSIGWRDETGELHELPPATFSAVAAQVDVSGVPESVRRSVLISCSLPNGNDVWIGYRNGAFRRIRGAGAEPFRLTPADLRGET